MPQPKDLEFRCKMGIHKWKVIRRFYMAFIVYTEQKCDRCPKRRVVRSIHVRDVEL